MEVDMKNHRYIFMLVIITGLGEYCSCWITCKSPSNRGVDWFIVYKVLKTVNTKGSEYFYMDSTQTPLRFSKYGRDIQSIKANPVYETLLPLYKKSKMLGNYGMYNDQPPNENAGQGYGHSKGVYAFGEDYGFWIISSVPEFAAAVPEKKLKNVDASYRYNDEQTKYGQIIFCVTLKPEHMEILGEAFDTTNPYLYSKSGKLPLKEDLTCTIQTCIIPFKSANKTELKLFAKSSAFGKDLYRDLIRGNLDSSLYVQTWRPKLKSSFYAKLQVINVENVCFENGLTYNTSLDHSKWAVATNKPWTCIGDINRHETQFKRGGLALCLKNAKVAKEFRKLIEKKNRCNWNLLKKRNQYDPRVEL